MGMVITSRMIRPGNLVRLLLVTAVIGCAPRGPQLPPLVPGSDGGRVVAEILAAQPCPSNIASDFEMILWTPEYRGLRMAGGLRAVWPDRLRIQIRVGAFWPVASIALNADSAFVSLPRLKGYWAGALEGDATGNPAALASSLLWLFCPSGLVESIDEPILSKTSDGWMLRGELIETEPPVWLELQLPKSRGEIDGVVFRDDQGRILLQASRIGRKSLGDILIPESVRLEIIDPAVRLDLRLLRPRPDPTPSADIFRIDRPPGTTWIAEEDLLSTFGAAATPR